MTVTAMARSGMSSSACYRQRRKIGARGTHETLAARTSANRNPLTANPEIRRTISTANRSPGTRNGTGDTRNGERIDYQNDANGRLVGQQGTGAWATFVYDGAGNTLVKWHQGQNPLTISYDVANRATTSVQGADITVATYDNNGSRAVEQLGTALTTFAYDTVNRLTGITYPGGTKSTYSYQGYDNLRRSQEEPGCPVTITIWDGSDYLQERS